MLIFEGSGVLSKVLSSSQPDRVAALGWLFSWSSGGILFCPPTFLLFQQTAQTAATDVYDFLMTDHPSTTSVWCVVHTSVNDVAH